MKKRFALLVDGGFVCKRLNGKSLPSAEQVRDACDAICRRQELADHDLLRIYYYDAPPATGNVTNPLDKRTVNLANTPQYRAAKALQDSLELSPDIAFRRGELTNQGWRIRARALAEIARTGRALASDDLVINLKQKGVDLRIGLDIARLSLLHLVETIVVVSGDSDMVPAFKFARREGVRVYAAFLGAPVKRDLKAHADLVLV